MTHEETIKRIQELTGGMALEEGCRVEVIFFESEEKDRNTNCSKFSEVGIITDIDNEYLEVDGNIFGDILVKDIVNGWLGENYEQIHCEILGKPITLAITIMAIHKSQPKMFGEATLSNQLSMEEHLNDTLLFLVKCWNLSRDNFNDQSEETKSFIRGLLGN